MKESLRLLLFFSICALSPLAVSAAKIGERVLICGVCRNVAPKLYKTKQIMESIGTLFEDHRILVYENNSTDNTAQLLADWAEENPRIWLQSERVPIRELNKTIVNRNRDGTLFVPEQIARARNIVLNRAMDAEYDGFDYVIWMDMDFVLFPDLEGVVDTFESPLEWDAVLAYGIDPDGIYWDWYAFRDSSYPIGSELLGMDWWYMEKKCSLSKQDPWHPVLSAFGGCGIYKKSSIQGCSYSALVTPDLELLAKRLIQDETHPQIAKYLRFNRKLKGIKTIASIGPHLPFIKNPDVGIVLDPGEDPVIWRMSTFVYQYPSVCEHVPFHASMIARGRDKLFINPRLIFRYGNEKSE